MTGGDVEPLYSDWGKPVGTAGNMVIRDHGSVVEFIIMCSDGATHVGAYSWTGVVNGTAVGGTTNLPAGFGSKSLGSWTVSTSQRVTWHQNATGTSGLGGAADHFADISRGPAVPTAPVSRPNAYLVDEIKATSARLWFNFDNGNNGGSPITSFDVYWALDPAFTTGVGSTNVPTAPGLMTGLRPMSDYWCHVRARNAVGAGPESQPNLTFRTTSGVLVSDGSAWTGNPVLVDDGTTMRAAEIFVSDGSAWKGAG